MISNKLKLMSNLVVYTTVSMNGELVVRDSINQIQIVSAIKFYKKLENVSLRNKIEYQICSVKTSIIYSGLLKYHCLLARPPFWISCTTPFAMQK